MSVENVHAFFHAAHNNKELKQKLFSKKEGTADGSFEERAVAIVHVAKEAGFEFTVGEYSEALKAQIEAEHATEIGEEMVERMRSASGRCAWNTIISTRTAGGGTFT